MKSFPYGLPAGVLLDFAGFAIPAGWLECDGASLLRASYPALFAAITSVQACTFVNASVTVVVADSSLLYVGEPVEASKLPAGTTVASIVNATEITVSQNATSAGAANATFLPFLAADATHFNLPTANNRVAVGNDSAGAVFTRKVLGEIGGEEEHVLGTGEAPTLDTSGYVVAEGATAAVTGYYAAGSAHNNLPPYLVVRKIIKT